MEGIIKAWGRILAGYQPNLSIEITRECPLTCPGCYAYGSDHLGGDVKLRELQDFKGQHLVDAPAGHDITAHENGDDGVGKGLVHVRRYQWRHLSALVIPWAEALSMSPRRYIRYEPGEAR